MAKHYTIILELVEVTEVVATDNYTRREVPAGKETKEVSKVVVRAKSVEEALAKVTGILPNL